MKKILALILAALMVLTMVACAAKAEPAADAEQTTTTEPAEETTPEQTAPAEETTEEPAVGGTISVFATSYTDAKLEMFQEIINDFTAETGIQVDLITPGSEGEAQLKTMMASNSLPDVWMTHGWSLLRYSEYLKVVNDQPWFDSIDQGLSRWRYGRRKRQLLRARHVHEHFRPDLQQGRTRQGWRRPQLHPHLGRFRCSL